MEVKVLALVNNHYIISQIDEVATEDIGQPDCKLTNPHCVYADKQYLAEDNEDRSVQITLSPWILLTADKEILVPKHQVITIVEPIDSVKEMYSEKVNGSDGTGTDK